MKSLERLLFFHFTFEWDWRGSETYSISWIWPSLFFSMFFILMKSLGSHVPIRMCIWRQLILLFSIFLTGRASVLTFVIFCLVSQFYILPEFSFMLFVFWNIHSFHVCHMPSPFQNIFDCNFDKNKSGKTFFTLGDKSQLQRKVKLNLRCNKETALAA